MELSEVLSTVLRKYGKNLMAERRLINFLDDYNAFDSCKGTRLVVETFLKRDFGKQVLNLDSQNPSNKEMKARMLIQQLCMEGLQREYVSYCLDSICYAMGWQNKKPKCPNGSEMPKPIPVHDIRIAVKGISFNMIKIDGGDFVIGASTEQGRFAAFDEKPPVKVRISTFYLSEIPVTQALYKVLTNQNPSFNVGDDLPVERVSYEDCEKFIDQLNQHTGSQFRLPTEAEWEYAARGGIKGKRMKYSGADDVNISDYVWYGDNSSNQSHEVGTKLPNELGLYDMSGNVSEWCSDWYSPSYANNGGEVDPQGPEEGVDKVYRGGSWYDKAMNCRVSKRFGMNPKYKNKLVGFRLAATYI